MRGFRIIIHYKAFTQGGAILCVLDILGDSLLSGQLQWGWGELVGSRLTSADLEKQKSGWHFCNPLFELALDPSDFKE